ncbi:MAG: hypothetical protein KatS3mg002_1233 [Candidatus Woesearchaeota archaeon]|nr:MAG: hypothetical protein KatS3mg002_1233 [Candidatus Woesearchaeota archaeon]
MYLRILKVPTFFALRNYTFNITIGDNFNVSTVLFESNLTGSINTITLDNYTEYGGDRIYYYTISNIVPGVYYYKWIMNDSAGNFNNTQNFYYNITKANSSIYALIDGINNNKTIIEDNYANISLQLDVPYSGYVELLINNITINNGTYGIDNIYNYTFFEDPGIYNITAIYYETQNYTYSENRIFLNVTDITPPEIILVSPVNNSFVSFGDINLQFIVNDKSAIQNCSVYINSVLIDNSSNISTGVLQGFTVNLGIGNYSWYIDCYDAAGNYNFSVTRNFTALNASIIVANLTLSNNSYQSGDTAIINITTTGFFGESLNADFNAYIINGNTTVPWWNNSYKYRKNILINNTYNITLNQSIELNITGFNGTISNCTKLRLIYFDGIENILLPYEVISQSIDSCNIWFNVNIPALSQSNNYYIYYDNSTPEESGSINVNGIKVQRGTVAGTTTSLTANIETANRSKSFVLFTINAASSLPTIIQFDSSMTTDNQITFNRYGSGTNANISWQLIEGSDITVQRGSGALAAATAEINFTINEVNLNESFLIIDGRVNSGTAGNNIQGYFTGRFINSTTISLRRAATGTAATASYQVVEWKNTRVQSGNVTFATISTLQNINPVNTSRALIVLSRTETGSNNIVASWVRASFVNSTTINISRGAASGTASVEWFVVELPENYNVQNGSLTVSTADVNMPVNPVIMRKSFHVEKWSSNQASTTYQNVLMTVRLTNITNLFFDKQTTTGVNTINWFLIEEKQPAYSISNAEELVGNISSTTAPLGVYTWYWSTFNKTLGNYSLVVKADKEGYQSDIAYSYFEITPDYTLPIVELISPENMHIAGQGYFNFSYKPYDWNLNNCTLYYGTPTLIANQTNNTPVNNATNNFTNIYLRVGLYEWNVLCYDSFGNSAFAPSNYILNITGPDLFLNESSIWFESPPYIEGKNITIFVNITNQGLSPAENPFLIQFYRNDPLYGGIQFYNTTIAFLNPQQSTIINTSYILDMGINNIFIVLDGNNSINETLEDNNKANNSIILPIYQYYYGNVTADILLGSDANKSIIMFGNMTTYEGYLFIADKDSSFSFTNLQSIGRNKNGLPTANDFSDIDSALNITGLPDSIDLLWTNNTNTPIDTMIINGSSTLIFNVPVVNTTNSSYFRTGILWDTSDDLSFNDQYDFIDKEDLIFVTEVKLPYEGLFGNYSYEIKIPAKLREYKGTNNVVSFYYEIK